MATTLVGSVVRNRMADLNLDWPALADRSGIPARTLQNTTKPRNPDSISLARVGQLLEALNPADIKRRGLERLRAQDILASGGDGTPDPPPEQPKPKPKPKGRGKRDPKGPRRTTADRSDEAVAS